MPEKGFATRQIHDRVRPGAATPRVSPIHLTAGFTFEEYEQAAAHFQEGTGYAYTRIANPTIEEVEHTIARLEGGVGGLLLASGQAATTVAILTVAAAGDHVVASNHIYEGTRGLLLDTLTRFGVTADFVDDIHDPSAWRRSIRDNTRALFAESISNASNRLIDTEAIADVAHEHGIPLIVDNTFATPYLYRPLEHGADVVVHSASKFLTGHGTVIGGVIIDAGTFDPEANGPLFPHLVTPARGSAKSVAERHGASARLAYARESIAPRLGPTPSPFNAFLIGQGIETLSLRVDRQSQNALAVARWLEAQPGVAGVDYVGLESHPDHVLAVRDLPRGYGAVFSFTLDGDADVARSFIEALDVFTHMTHLGDVRSLILHPASTSHVLLSETERAEVGVLPGTVRVSIGIEDVADLIDDLAAALGSVSGVRGPDPEVSLTA